MNIVCIDGQVNAYKAFIADLGTETEGYLLDATQDGVEQMKHLLSGYADLSAIQVMSNYPTSALNLGNNV